MKTKQETLEIIKTLEKYYENFECRLNFNSPFELLIATILSAQCTDERVNIVTKKLFADANTPSAILSLGEGKLLPYIKSCGLSNTKCKNIIKTCFTLCNEYDEQVPKTMEELTKLNGVGRKTANVVMSNAYGIPAIAVDTHVQRVSNRLGIAKSDDVLKTEQTLMKKIPKEYWSRAHHWIIWHGRKICNARNPKCEECMLSSYCDYYKKTHK